MKQIKSELLPNCNSQSNCGHFQQQRQFCAYYNDYLNYPGNFILSPILSLTFTTGLTIGQQAFCRIENKTRTQLERIKDRNLAFSE